MRRRVFTEVGFDSDVSSTFTSWTDVSAYVSSIDVNRGRSKELDAIEAGECTVSLDNLDGRFTPGRSSTLLGYEDFGIVSAASGTTFFGELALWSYGAGVAGTRTISQSGNGAAVIQQAFPQNQYLEISLSTGAKTFPVTPGTVITVSYNAKPAATGLGTDAQKVFTKVIFEDASGATVGSVDGSTYVDVFDFRTFVEKVTVPVGAVYARPVIQGYRLSAGTGEFILYLNFIKVEPDAPYAGKIKPRRPVRVFTALDDNLVHFECVRPATYDLDKPRFFLAQNSLLSIVNDGIPVWQHDPNADATDTFAYVGANSDADQIMVKAGQQVTVSAAARCTVAGGQASVGVAFFAKSNLSLVSVLSSFTLTSAATYSTINFTYTAPADGAVRMVLWSKRAAGTGGASRYYNLKMSFPSTDGDYAPQVQNAYSGMYPVFRGFVDSWDVDTDGFTSKATVKAVDWLGVASRPLNTYTREWMQRAYRQYTQVAGDSFYYWPCDGAADDTTEAALIGDLPLTVMPYAAFPPATGGFTSDKVIPLQDGSFGSFTVRDTNWAKGAVLSLVDKNVPSIVQGEKFGTAFWVNMELPTAGTSQLFFMGNAAGQKLLSMQVDSTGTVTITWTGGTDFLDVTLTPTWKIAANTPTYIIVKMYKDIPSGNSTIAAWKNNTNAEVILTPNTTRYSPAFIQWGGKNTPGDASLFFHGSISHIVYGSGAIIDIMTNALWLAGSSNTGYTESGMLGTILDFANYPTYRRLDTGNSNVLPPSWDTATELSGLLQDTAGDGDGTFFMGPEGAAVFHNRSRRFTADSRWNIAEWSGALRFTLDAQYVLNQVTAERLNGLSRLQKDDSSISTYGLRDKTVRRNVASLDELNSAAGWVLHKYTESIPRIESLVIDASALNAAGDTDKDLIGLAHGGALSDKVTLTGLPVSAPSDSLIYFIEGVNTSIQVDGARVNYSVTFYISDANRSLAFVLEDAVFGVLDADASVLTY